MFSTKELTTQKSREELIEEFFNRPEPWKFSFSAISLLLYSPSAWFERYVRGIKDDKQSAEQVRGSLIHAFILEPDTIKDRYITSPSKVPEGNGKIIADYVYQKYLEQESEEECGNVPLTEMSDFESDILDKMKELNYYQQLKTDQQRLDKVLVDNIKGYFDYLKARTGKKLVSQEDYDFCKKAAQVIREHPRASELLGLGEFEGDGKIVIHNELYLESQITNQDNDILYPWWLKGFIDNLKIDHINKIIWLNDVKTSGKELSEFPESVEYWSYNLQAALYYLLVELCYRELLIQDYEIRFNFIVIDKFLQCYCFPVRMETMEKWLDKLEEAFGIVDYHYTNRSFGLKKQFELNTVEL